MQAILLDRDGVINRERRDYVKSWDEFEFLPGVLPALRELAFYAWPILVITNQSVINRGLVREDEIQAIHRNLVEQVAATGGRINGIYVCPHRPDEQCDCRKPKPGLLLRAAQEYQLQLNQCLFIGDSLTDMQAAAAVNCPAIRVRSGLHPPEPGHAGATTSSVLPDLYAVVQHVIRQGIV